MSILGDALNLSQKMARSIIASGVVCCITFVAALSAQTYKRIHGFNLTDGQTPTGLVHGADGALYGTTQDGGTNDLGTIFKITTLGKFTTIYSFCSKTPCADGSYPVGSLIQSTDGNFYGVTNGGGVGFGTVFKITPGGVLTTLYTFCKTGYPTCPDGYEPLGGLVRASDGNFYGTTGVGGLGAYGYGTVFKITSSGSLTTLHSFNGTDGDIPEGQLIQASDGNLYGITREGGGAGNIFRITLAGTFANVYNFCSQNGCTDGMFPEAGLIQGADGNLYGTTNGQSASLYGTVFKITLDGSLTTLHTFCSFTNCSDGAYPVAPVVQGNDGNIYGTTTGIGGGTVFEITPDWTLTTLYSFCVNRGCFDGDAPNALILDTNGTFYGTTFTGGLAGSCSAFGCGVVFSLATGLSPFVETLPTSGRVGSSVAILGTNLTGATSVTFNHTSASFTVKSSSQIIATVPAGATTGTVQVVTPSGTLTSNVAFSVTP